MKRLAIAITFSTAFILFLSHMACDKHPVTIPAPPPTPTPTATPLQFAVTIAGSAFNPAAITITSGSNVVFVNTDSYGHTVQPDDGFFNCGTNQSIQAAGTVPGDTVTFSFPPGPVTINYHCWFHSSCFGGPCDGSCTGMIGSIVVQ